MAFAILLFAILFGIANGLQNTFKEAFGTDANNSIVIFPGRTTKAYKGLQVGRQIQFKNDDRAYILDEFGDKVQYITSKVNKSVSASFKGEKNFKDRKFLENPIKKISESQIFTLCMNKARGKFFNELTDLSPDILWSALSKTTLKDQKNFFSRLPYDSPLVPFLTDKIKNQSNS